MAIQNRDLATSEQRLEIQGGQNSLVVTGASVVCAIIAEPCVFEAMTIVTAGLSGAPQYMPQVSRLTSGGLTTIALGVSTAIGLEYGSSGPVNWSGIRTAGSSLLILQSGDVLSLVSSVANTAALSVRANFIVKKTQDIVQHFSLST